MFKQSKGKKRDKETKNDSSNATTINAITVIETLNNNNSTTSKPTTNSKFDEENTKVFTSEKEEEVDNFSKERLLKEKENEVLTERNRHSTPDDVIKKLSRYPNGSTERKTR